MMKIQRGLGSLLLLTGMLTSWWANAVQVTVDADVAYLWIGGEYDVSITTAWPGGSAPHANVHIDMDPGASPDEAHMVLDSAAERAMILGLISHVATSSAVQVTGELVSPCGVDQIDPIQQVTFD